MLDTLTTPLQMLPTDDHSACRLPMNLVIMCRLSSRQVNVDHVRFDRLNGPFLKDYPS